MIAADPLAILEAKIRERLAAGLPIHPDLIAVMKNLGLLQDLDAGPAVASDRQ